MSAEPSLVANPQIEPHYSDVIAEVFEQGVPARELALLCIRYAAGKSLDQLGLDETNQGALINGWRHAIANYRGGAWTDNRRQPRSGRSNRSPLAEASASGPGGVLSEEVALNDGRSYLLGDLTLTLLGELAEQYGARRRSAACGEQFFASLKTAMRKAKVEHVRDLGQEQVEALRAQHGYRV